VAAALAAAATSWLGVIVVRAQVTNTACAVTITGPLAPVHATGGALPLSIAVGAPGCTWTLSSNVTWLKIVNPTGTGNGTAYVVIPANGGGNRSGNITNDGGGSFPIPQLASAAVQTTVNFGTPTAIPDNGTVNIALPVSGLTRPISDVTVSVYLTHTFDADLVLSLIGTDDTTVRLSQNRGGGDDNYGSACTPAGSRTLFSDAATSAIASGAPPFASTYRPEQPLAAFRNKIGGAPEAMADVAASLNRVRDPAGVHADP